ADDAVTRLLPHFLPGADGHPGRLLARDAGGVRQHQLWVRHVAVRTDRWFAVRQDLRANPGDGRGRVAPDDRCGLSRRVLDGAVPEHVQDAGAAAVRGAFLDFLPD